MLPDVLVAAEVAAELTGVVPIFSPRPPVAGVPNENPLSAKHDKR